MRDHPIRILLIEDNPGDARLIKEYLGDDNCFELDSVTGSQS
jgi:hypothetical protein